MSYEIPAAWWVYFDQHSLIALVADRSRVLRVACIDIARRELRLE